MLLRISQVLTPTELADVRRLVLNADWADGRITAGSQSGAVKNNRQLPEEQLAAQQARHIVSVALARCPMFVTGALPKSVFRPLFNRYGGSSSNDFGNHIDNAVCTHAATARQVRTEISCTLFLRPPGDYDGGELVVEDTCGEQRIKFDAGDLVIYPCTSVHRIDAVTRANAWLAFSGLKAWCGETTSAACCTRWTWRSRRCDKKPWPRAPSALRPSAKASKWFA